MSWKNNKPKPMLPSTSLTNTVSNSPVIKDKYKCKNCLKYFDPENNGKCYFHTGKAIVTGLRTCNYYDEIKYDCCEKVQIGFNPTLKEALGCQVKDAHELLSN